MIVLGGTAALHAYRAWGAVLFWSKAKTRLTPKIQRRTFCDIRWTLDVER